MGSALDRVADLIVHGARESFLRTLTTRLVSALRGLVLGTTSEARAANALDMASTRVMEQALGTWAEYRPKVTAETTREVGQALRDRDETLQRELVEAVGADLPWGLTNRARNDLAQAKRGTREVVGRQNVAFDASERKAIAQRAAAAQAAQGATDAHMAVRAWYEVAGAAITRVDMGDDPQAVMADAVAELARRGLETIDYRSGRRTTVDAAVRRHIDSQLNQAANDAAIRQCEEWGVELVMVDAHWGARPSHAAWQGRAYGLHGEVTVGGVTYPGLCESTGYLGRNGWPLGAQLAGVNCRHRIYPYIPGVSVIPGTSPDEVRGYEKKYSMTSAEYYEATQRQRALERSLRSAKREAAFLEDGGLDATAQRYRIGDLQRKLREHCGRTGLERDPTRERAYGVTHQPRGLTSKTVRAHGHSYEASSIMTRNGFNKSRWKYTREYAAVYDERGRLVSGPFQGPAGSGTVTMSIPAGETWRDKRMTHTHPFEYGGTFSALHVDESGHKTGDIFHLTDANLLSIDAVCNEGTYTLERTRPLGRKERKTFLYAAADASALAENEVGDRMEAEWMRLRKTLTTAKAQDEWDEELRVGIAKRMHVWYTENAGKYGYSYTFKQRKR